MKKIILTILLLTTCMSAQAEDASASSVPATAEDTSEQAQNACDVAHESQHRASAYRSAADKAFGKWHDESVAGQPGLFSLFNGDAAKLDALKNESNENAEKAIQAEHQYQQDEVKCEQLAAEVRDKEAKAEQAEIDKFEQAKTEPKPIAVADTISNGHIVLLSNPCPPWFGIEVSFQYIVFDAFNNPLVDAATGISGCWFPQGEQASGALPKGAHVKYIVGVDGQGNLSKWRKNDFKKTNHWPK